MFPEKVNPTAGDRGARSNSSADFKLGSSLPESADLLQRARRHDYALLVTAARRDGVVVSQLFTSMHPAERKLARCRERGLPASMTLVRLVPVASNVDPADVLGGDSGE